MNQILIILLLSSFVIIFFLGLFVGINGFLIEDVNLIIQEDVTKSLEKDQVSTITKLELLNLINFKNESDILEKRTELINLIWKSNDLPNEFPSSVESNFDDIRYNDLKNLKAIEKINIEMKNSVNSIVYLFLAEQSNQKLFIYHQGHGGDFYHGKQTIQKLLNSGFSVAAFSMPLHGMNSQPEIEFENIGKIKFFKHNQFVLLEEDDFSTLSYFFSPINTTLNYLSENYGFTDYYMTGISGGGWTSTIYPAIDTRISKSFPVAGTSPLSLRNVIDDVGDYEQFHPELFSITNYFQIYVMSSYGSDREFVQIFNKYDTCCFFDESYEIYGETLQNFVHENNYGKFTLIVDDTHKEHKISDFILDLIINKSDP